MPGVQTQVLINAAIATVGEQKQHPRTCVFKGMCQTYCQNFGFTGVLANDVDFLLPSLARNRAMTATQAPPISLRPVLGNSLHAQTHSIWYGNGCQCSNDVSTWQAMAP